MFFAAICLEDLALKAPASKINLDNIKRIVIEAITVSHRISIVSLISKN